MIVLNKSLIQSYTKVTLFFNKTSVRTIFFAFFSFAITPPYIIDYLRVKLAQGCHHCIEYA